MDAPSLTPASIVSERGAPARAPDVPPADALFRKLSWLTLFRLVEVTVLLGATAAWQWRSNATGGAGPLYLLILVTYALSLGLAVVLRTRRALVAVAFAQIAVDVGIAGAVVAFTGFGESIFVFMFLLAIVNGAILLYRTGAVWGAGLSVLTYGPLYMAGPAARQLQELFIHLAAFVATAALSSYLAEQLRRTGETLREREGDLAAITALHESVVQSLSSGLLTLDTQDRITYLNRAGEQMTGLQLDDIVGQPERRWFPAFEVGRGRGETPFVNARDQRLCLGYSRFPLIGRGGRRIGSAVIFQDLTAFRAMEEQVQRSERLADLGRLTAGLAHELRNPLASISGCIELLRANCELRGEDTHLMDIVLRETSRLDQLVTHFLTFTRPESPRRVDADLAAIARDTVAVFANDPVASAVQLVSDLSPAPVRCDPDQLRQVLWNLLRNAAESAGAREDGGGRVRVHTERTRDRALLVVEDNGAGIARSDVTQLFTPFFTTKASGSGLGLATVQRIVDAHGGTVTVGVPDEGGARFSVALPCAAEEE